MKKTIDRAETLYLDAEGAKNFDRVRQFVARLFLNLPVYGESKLTLRVAAGRVYAVSVEHETRLKPDARNMQNPPQADEVEGVVDADN